MINDPEHPLTLEQLRVVNPSLIHVNNGAKTVVVYFTPTIPNCSMSTLIGLTIKVKLMNSLPSTYKIDVYVSLCLHF